MNPGSLPLALASSVEQTLTDLQMAEDWEAANALEGRYRAVLPTGVQMAANAGVGRDYRFWADASIGSTEKALYLAALRVEAAARGGYALGGGLNGELGSGAAYWEAKLWDEPNAKVLRSGLERCWLAASSWTRYGQSAPR